MKEMSNQPLVTLSIVSHGDSKKIHALLVSLQKHERDTARFQLILTDNLKNELPTFDPSPWASLHVLRNKHPVGFAENHNKAFELVQAKYFAVLNPDLIFTQPIFDRLIYRINNRQADLIAPQIIDEDGVIQDSFRSLPTPLGIIRRRLPMYRFQPIEPVADGLIYPDWIAAMFWLIPSNVYRTLEGMDKKYRLYFEDVDFCTRAKLQGLKLAVDSRLNIQHNAQRSSRSNIYFLSLHMHSAIRFFSSRVYKEARRKIRGKHI
jgi:GT2 family glycosyltransferase